ncbi:DUF3618 domain-containing protein [Micromonospora sp. WMMD1102]|uniref:DUF3618 domain-containing protein n=1 Tax=Micromonospora sp. WMMD1102 TaxID=3016105 RepID=UPI00241589D5|nr:DUF3618 domain-containing protein [Micromonospora sp. WMMD1102]MDG4786066.1 DUF3618 domain-containing protein [Micromonospora sp. WMMD1102]
MSSTTGNAAARTPSTSPSPGSTGSVPAVPSTDEPDAIRADIARTRAELGGTVQQLARRADVKTRAREKAAEVRGRAVRWRDRTAATAQVATVRARHLGRIGSGRATEATRRAVTEVRQRPVPYAGALAGLAAAGTAALLVRRHRAARTRTGGWRRWVPAATPRRGR